MPYEALNAMNRQRWHTTLHRYALLGLLAACTPAAMCQTMGASSSSTGSIQIPVTTTGLGATTYGNRTLNVMNQGGGPVVPSLTYSLPQLPKSTLPQQPFHTPKPFEPDLKIFETNR